MEKPVNLFGLGWKNGLFFSDGDSWAKQRRLTAPSFSHKNVELMSCSIAEQVDKFISKLRELADGKTVIQMDDQAFFYAISVTSAVAFGEISKECQDYMFGSLLPADFKTMFSYIMSRMSFPFPDFLWRYSTDYPKEAVASTGDKRFEKYCRIIITEKQKLKVTASSSATYRANFVDKLIATTSGGENALTYEELLGNVKTFYMAGSDTTSVVISWCLFYISVDKKLQQELQKEVDEALGLNATGEEAIAAMPRLLLFSACFKEAARLRSPVDNLIHEVIDKAVELSNGVVLSKGEDAFICTKTIMCNPKVYDEPLAFKPSRWLENTAEKLTEMNDSFIAFGYGPRICPGQVRVRVRV